MARSSMTDWNDPRELDDLDRRLSEVEHQVEQLLDFDQDGDVDSADAELRALLLSVLKNAHKPAAQGGD